MHKTEVKQIINNPLVKKITKKEYTNIELAVGLNRLDYDKASLVFGMSEITGISDRQARKYISVVALDQVGFVELIKEELINLNTASLLLNCAGDNKNKQKQIREAWLRYDGDTEAFIKAVKIFDFENYNDFFDFCKEFSKKYEINKKINFIEENVKEIRNQGSKEQQEELSKILKKYMNE